MSFASRKSRSNLSRRRWAVRIGLLSAAAVCCIAPLRHTALLVIADAWISVRPPEIQAAAGQRAASHSGSTNLEQQLLAYCLQLREEIDQLRPDVALADRLVEIDAVAGQVLWTSPRGRDTFVSLAESQGVAPDCVVAETAIDVGLPQSITPDGLVLAGRKLAGRVSDVGVTSASVTSTDSEEFEVTADIVRWTGSDVVVGGRGLFRGRGDGHGTLSAISGELPVRVGDRLMTTPSEIWSGQRLLIGTVARAELVDGEPDWAIEVEVASRLEPGAAVLVLRPRVRHEARSTTPLAPPASIAP